MSLENDRDVVRWIPGRWQRVGVSRRTWNRWMDGKCRIPRAVVELAHILVNGDLGAIDPAWNGWHVARGKLWDHGTDGHTPGSIRVWWWTWQRLAALRPRRTQNAIRARVYEELGVSKEGLRSELR